MQCGAGAECVAKDLDSRRRGFGVLGRQYCREAYVELAGIVGVCIYA